MSKMNEWGLPVREWRNEWMRNWTTKWMNVWKSEWMTDEFRSKISHVQMRFFWFVVCVVVQVRSVALCICWCNVCVHWAIEGAGGLARERENATTAWKEKLRLQVDEDEDSCCILQFVFAVLVLHLLSLRSLFLLAPHRVRELLSLSLRFKFYVYCYILKSCFFLPTSSFLWLSTCFLFFLFLFLKKISCIPSAALFFFGIVGMLL